MISLVLATGYLGVAALFLKVEDSRLMAFPLATVVSWHAFYACNFAGELLNKAVYIGEYTLSTLSLASVASLILVFARGHPYEPI